MLYSSEEKCAHYLHLLATPPKKIPYTTLINFIFINSITIQVYLTRFYHRSKKKENLGKPVFSSAEFKMKQKASAKPGQLKSEEIQSASI